MKLIDEIKEDIIKYIHSTTGLLTFSELVWKQLMQKYNCKEGPEKDIFLQACALVTKESGVPYPRKNSIMDIEDIKRKFIKFTNVDETHWIKRPGEFSKVLEKWSDYGRPFSQYGIAVIDAPSGYNSISDYFTYEDRMNCPYFSSPAPADTFNDPNKLAKLLKYFYRKPAWQDGGGEINKQAWLGAFSLGTYQASQFKLSVVKTIHHMTKATKMLDTSSGWGDRMAGFYGSLRSEEYVGNDPNLTVWKKYQEMAIFYENLLGCKNPKLSIYDDRFVVEGKKKVTIFNAGAEDLPWDTDIMKGFDCAFTSPPYFSTELYAKGLPGEENQSWNKFSTYESWLKEFFIPVSMYSYEALKDGGHFLCNIMDPKIKGKRYYCCDAMIDALEEKYPKSFLGQIGMKFTLRAGPDTKTKEDFNNCNVEPVWVFRKGEKRFDLMDCLNTTSLKNFF